MGKDYKATIITPFHNTDMSMFTETFKSVKKQTIGFSNIEWIIVLHNCKQEYIDAVTELTGKYKNVFLKELYNDARSASSPRNYGLEFVTSPYIEFLDSDDSISEDTVEKCVEEMEKHHPQIVIFRMAYKKQNESVQSIITDVTLWNPLEKEIVLTGERLRCQELFSSINFCTHNRFFDADFIQSNNIRFDEDITMAEDAYFTLTCYSRAEKIVVLPQFIGHNYFVNSDSAVQSMEKPREAVLHFSYGFKKMFDLLIDINAYYNHFFLTILFAYLQYAYYSPDFTDDDWETLRNDMAPYAKLLNPPPENKFFSKEEGQIVYNLVTRNILKHDVERADQSFYNRAKVLGLAIKNNEDTCFGLYYDFKSIDSVSSFRKKVPLADIKDYRELIRLRTEVGESHLFTNGKIEAYAYDFNESDEMRLVPVSDETCSKMGKQFIERLDDEVTLLMMESKPKGMPLNDGSYYNSPIGIMVNKGMDAFSLSYRGFDGKLTSPLSLIFPVEQVKTDYLILLSALRNKHVTQIYGSNTWVVLNYIEKLIKDADALCEDIEKGTIHYRNKIPNMLYEEMKARNAPDPDRAAQLRKALQQKDTGDMLKEIWPDLKRIIAKSGGNFTLYTKRLKRFIGDVKLEFDDFVTPFGILARQAGDGNVFILDHEEGFYEFLPITVDEVKKPLLLSQVKTGELYELVFTNRFGIYRMLTDIYIKPCEITNQKLHFEECIKPYIGDGFMICYGEALEKALDQCLGDNLYDYFGSYNADDNCLDIFVELEDEDEGTDYSDMVEEALIDDKIYSKARENGLRECSVRVIDKETNLLWRDMRRSKLNAPSDCFQPVHNISNTNEIPLLRLWND